jgi:hypothetical protein
MNDANVEGFAQKVRREAVGAGFSRRVPRSGIFLANMRTFCAKPSMGAEFRASASD